jgi:hypothetical protein
LPHSPILSPLFYLLLSFSALAPLFFLCSPLRQLHNEFSMKFHEWLIDRTVTREHDLSIATGGMYGSYSKPGDQEAPPPSEFKVFLITLWGALLFTAFDVCWIYLDYYRDIDLALSPEYLTHHLSPKDIIGRSLPSTFLSVLLGSLWPLSSPPPPSVLWLTSLSLALSDPPYFISLALAPTAV